MAGYAYGGAGASSSASRRPARADTLDLKQKLAVALGENGTKYWQTFVQFCKGAIDRSEFEELAQKCLKSEHVHLHNSLILGILYNASADVPGPSSGRRGGRTRVRRRLPDGTILSDDETDDEEPSKKRLRALVAGLPKKERMRLKNLERAGKLGTNSAGGALGLGWAGSAADLLEKKRKEEEKRKVVEDRRKVREVKSAIGARDWKGQTLQSANHLDAVRGKLSLSTQQAVARAMLAPLCVESKHLPDLDGIRDRMTLLAVESGMPGGVQPQAAAMVLSALQDHLHNVATSIITKIRANRPNGIRTIDPQLPASLSPVKNAAYGRGAYTTSPAHTSMELDDSAAPSEQNSPTRQLRGLHSDLSSRASTSGVGTSFADSSMLSLASTAPTSLTGPSSPSVRDGDSSQLHDSSFTASQDDDDDDHHRQANGISAKKSHLHALSSSSAPSTPVENGTGRLTLADMSFLLELAPHSVVEPMGQGTQERLLAPDWDEDAILASAGDYDRLVVETAKRAATTKISDIGGEGKEAAMSSGVRGRFVIDQSAPLRLLDRKGLAESAVRPTKSGLSLSGTNGAAAATSGLFKDSAAGKGAGAIGVLHDVNGRKSANRDAPSASAAAALAAAKGREELWDVVDPVALFESLCE
ncbi:uncharacterized protein PFL1_06464 [Pseudozyma flocculosa PF-1]|uniref:Related to HFI1 - adaptor protein required for structural integrity of the SAGA complex n=2 Tax=Pseudozyma flocculosa TaxID=84751 RepID=A0A5C3ETJ6_9BASI|nr:uncharacterized protein PFL1_06464 [Pseudozyma flocculosa PF-1]EPQ26010.1 hypothetical protein PFL1_06464 [Pseudozyma flocculosa PF-1]SPO35683.1 related to HFI1 - adaptor protein required for structural integrity of the SAGA complex [Pseudozyma flocculosa]